jgi:hypothetical protein
VGIGKVKHPNDKLVINAFIWWHIVLEPIVENVMDTLFLKNHSVIATFVIRIITFISYRNKASDVVCVDFIG